MRIFLGTVAACALLAACGTAPPATPERGATKLATAEKPVEKKICKTLKTIGSNMPQRICSTQAEWDDYAKQGKGSVEDYQRDRDTSGS